MRHLRKDSITDESFFGGRTIQRWRFMSDKLQFVVCSESTFHRSIDKLKFVGHRIQHDG